MTSSSGSNGENGNGNGDDEHYDDLGPVEVDDEWLKRLEDAARDDASRPPIQPPGERKDDEGGHNGSDGTGSSG